MTEVPHKKCTAKQGYLHPHFAVAFIATVENAICRILPHCASCGRYEFVIVISSGYPSEPASEDTGSDQHPEPYSLLCKESSLLFDQWSLLLSSLFKMKWLCFMNQTKRKRPDKIQVLLTPILRQALLTTYCVAIRSVRIFFL